MANILFRLMAGAFWAVFHPFFVSMTEINYNAGGRELELSVRIFTDDFENTLRKNYGGKIDLTHPQDAARMNQMVAGYISKHLQLVADGKPLSLSFVGFEQQEESTWCYFEVKNVDSPKKLQVTNSLLHDFNTSQINMMHVKANGREQSTKLDYPATGAEFRW